LIDISSAGSIYSHYCSSQGYLVNAQTTQNSAQPASRTGTVNPTSSNGLNGPSPTTSSGGSSSSGSDGGLSAGAIGGITVAGFVATVIFGVLGIWYARKQYITMKKKRKEKAERTHHGIVG